MSLRSVLHHPRLRANRRAAVLAGVAIAVLAAPIAIAGTIQGGHRNPRGSGVAYSQSTQIIGSLPGYAVRMSNYGSGGGAIDGCRSLTGGPACVEADNLKTGQAFDFLSSGSVGGTIHLANPNGSPFTTNATGVATGLNANYLQGNAASAFLGATAQAADSAKLGGVPASSYVQTSQLSSQLASQLGSYAQTNQLLFAVVSQNGSLGTNRGATASAASATANSTSYTVTFSANVSRCSFTASPTGPALASGSIGVANDATNPDIVDVNAPAPLPQGFHLQVIC
jgi:hypothetical protein